MANFTLRQLDYACAVAGDGGIAQAARNLSISQPSVAQGLDKLEAATGLVLFERHHARGVTLTAQGRQFLHQARGLCAAPSSKVSASRSSPFDHLTLKSGEVLDGPDFILVHGAWTF